VARMSLDSAWKVGVKHGWWKGVKNGDVLLFALSLAVINSVYEKDPKAVSGGVVRKGLGMLRGDGWVDRALVGRGRSDDDDDTLIEERDIKQSSMDPLVSEKAAEEEG